jgi:hypothetical protein
MLIALAATIAPMLAHSIHASSCRSKITPTSAAITGLTLMNRPKARVGTRRKMIRSARYGRAEERIPAVIAHPKAAAVGGWRTKMAMPIGR